MKYEILISTMNNTDYNLHTKMNLFTDSIIINQFPNGVPSNEPSFKVYECDGVIHKYYNVEDRGLSKSRNLAIKYSQADVCILADDDMIFNNNAFDTLKEIYRNTDSEINVYKVLRSGGNRPKVFGNEIKRLNKLSSFKISSVEISFRREFVLKQKILFDELLGAGSQFKMGEENKFLINCLSKGLTITYFPYEIAVVSMDDSSWFNGYSQEYFKSRGASYFAISKVFFPILIIQFITRKRKELGLDNTKDFYRSIKWSFIGSLNYYKKQKG